jgi:hypothetical protein
MDLSGELVAGCLDVCPCVHAITNPHSQRTRLWLHVGGSGYLHLQRHKPHRPSCSHERSLASTFSDVAERTEVVARVKVNHLSRVLLSGLSKD